MSGGTNLFNVGVSGLRVAQRSLGTVGHNISNVNTEGFSRQRVELAARPHQRTGAGFVGTGVDSVGVTRAFSSFVTGQLRTSTSLAGQSAVFSDLASRVDNLLADPDTGVSPALRDFFGAVQDLANDPSSTTGRQVLLGEARSLVARFQSLDGQLDALRAETNSRLGDLVAEVNAFADNIAQVNQAIVTEESRGAGQQANDLRDQRDELVRQLAERVNVTAFEQSNGALNVTIGNGHALVVNTSVTGLSVVRNPYDPAVEEVAVTLGGTSVIISGTLSGGAIQGVFDFRDQVLDPARDGLGRVAVALARDFNDQHRLGVDLKGQAGQDFFGALDVVSPQVLSRTGNTGAPPAQLAVSVSDTAALVASDYRLDFDGATHTLTRLSDGSTTTLTGFPANDAVVDGLRIALGAGSIAAGDSFLLRPTREGARRIALAITSTDAVAAAAPVVTGTGTANTGDGVISAGVVNSPNNELAIVFNNPGTTFDVTDRTSGATLARNVAFTSGAPISFNGLTFDIDTSPGGPPPPGSTYLVSGTVSSAVGAAPGVISQPTVAPPDPSLADPVTITFDNPPTSFTVAGATTGTPTVSVPYTSGQPISFNGWTVQIRGTPAAGDTFTVAPNSGGVGDNRNALLLAGLQTTERLNGQTATFADAFGQVVTDVGTSARQAQINHAAQSTLLGEIGRAREEVSGVNLDEEAASLLRFQQAYQASAQVIAAANTIFDALLTATRR